MWESAPGWTAALLLLTAVQSLLPLVGLYLLKMLIDTVAAGAGGGRIEDFRSVLTLLLTWLGISLIGIVASVALGVITGLQGRLAADRMMEKVQGKALELDLAYFEDHHYYDVLNRAAQEAPSRPVSIVTSFARLVQSAVTVAGIGALLVSLNPLLLPVLMVAALPAAILRLRQVRSRFATQQRLTPLSRRAEYYHALMTLPAFAKEVRLFGLGRICLERARQIREEIRGTYTDLERHQSFSTAFGQAAALLPLYAACGFLAYQAIHGAITVGGMVMYFQVLQRGQGALDALTAGVSAFYEHNVFLARIHEFLSLPRRIADPEEPRPFPAAMQQGITFENVSFRYPSTPRQALARIDLVVRPGEVVALVGENGAGKSTLVKLLGRLYDPEGGSIRIDGIDIRQFQVADLQRSISVVFQDYVRYDMTARDNIWVGNVELNPADPLIEQAAEKSGADEVIRGLKDGYDTYLGKYIQDGEQLSTGEWQKLALARAFVRDAQIVVLDEPTSALDPMAEYEVFSRFRELLDGRTAILISHRLSTVRMADYIYVMRDGRIVESGTHDELLCRGAAYAALFEAQAENYR